MCGWSPWTTTAYSRMHSCHHSSSLIHVRPIRTSHGRMHLWLARLSNRLTRIRSLDRWYGLTIWQCSMLHTSRMCLMGDHPRVLAYHQIHVQPFNTQQNSAIQSSGCIRRLPSRTLVAGNLTRAELSPALVAAQSQRRVKVKPVLI